MIKMIYITGDTHGDFRRFSSNGFPEGKMMTKKDYVIVTGDFGIWDKSKEQKHHLDWLDDKPFTTLFVSGNHENFDLLNEMKDEMWRGGLVNFVRPSIIHLKRGQVFNIDGISFFTFGGARSHDIKDGILDPNDPHFKKRKRLLDMKKGMYRILGKTWWPEEMPSQEEFDLGIKNLKEHQNKVDFILTHCGPNKVMDKIEPEQYFYKKDALTNYLEEISNTVEFKAWFMGHYHINKTVMGKYSILFEQILQIK